MELFLIIKILLLIGIFVTTYAVLRNLDIIKIILIYCKDVGVLTANTFHELASESGYSKR